MSDRTTWEARYAGRGAGRLAPPSPLLTAHRDMLPQSGWALDVACGDGRNALWMARQGFVVDALDIAFAALRCLADAAAAEHLPVRPIQVDLERFALPADRYALVVNVRYLQRSLLPALRRAVAPGGVIAFETFLHEQARIGHPRNPDFLLEPGELRTAFAGFETLIDEEGLHDAGGGAAYLARLLARRPPID
jgi:SAM-dependent methyltransferase